MCVKVINYKIRISPLVISFLKNNHSGNLTSEVASYVMDYNEFLEVEFMNNMSFHFPLSTLKKREREEVIRTLKSYQLQNMDVHEFSLK